MADDCLFCKIIEGEMDSDKVYEDDHVFAFRDINPVAPTHILIVPKEHISGVEDVGDEDTALVGRLFTAARDIAEEEGLDDGYRLVVNHGPNAGQTVYHIHLHLLGGRELSWPPG